MRTLIDLLLDLQVHDILSVSAKEIYTLGFGIKTNPKCKGKIPKDQFSVSAYPVSDINDPNNPEKNYLIITVYGCDDISLCPPQIYKVKWNEKLATDALPRMWFFPQWEKFNKM